jgi:hypothetical protein
MQVHVSKSPGLRNDLLLTIPRAELEGLVLHIANRQRLAALPGLVRHVPVQDPDERREVAACKIPVEQHLALMSWRGVGLLATDGSPQFPIFAVGSRNVGNNHGFVAWQADQSPRLFHVRGDPVNYSAYSCLVAYAHGRLAIRSLRFHADRVVDQTSDITDSVAWCVFGNQVLRDGAIVDVSETADQFYDVRHILAFDRENAAGRQIENEIFADYPRGLRENVVRAWRELGVPRNRFLHNCLGLSDDSVFILQREGTVEEMAQWLRDAGARDGLILDNGASVFCWSWWQYPHGGFLFAAPDYRPNASAVIVFVLKGSAALNLPAGSVSYSII